MHNGTFWGNPIPLTLKTHLYGPKYCSFIPYIHHGFWGVPQTIEKVRQMKDTDDNSKLGKPLSWAKNHIVVLE